MQAQDIMTRKVVSAAPDTTVDQVVALMMTHHISAIPILEKSGAIAGIVSEGDLMRRVEGAEDQPRSWWLRLFSGTTNTASDFVRNRGRHAKDIMTRHVVTVEPDMPVGDIARLLEKERIKRVPVVDNGRLAGIVSRANLLHALAAIPVAKLGKNADERKKRDTVLDALSKVPGLNPSLLNVVVESGRVDVWGIVDSDAEAVAAKIALENIEGLGEVAVHLRRVPYYGWGI